MQSCFHTNLSLGKNQLPLKLSHLSRKYCAYPKDDFITPGAVKRFKSISGCGLVRDPPMGRQQATFAQLGKKFFSKTLIQLDRKSQPVQRGSEWHEPTKSKSLDFAEWLKLIVQGLAVGRYMSETILGFMPALDLSRFSPERILENRPLTDP
jgi:hypothetical protein